MTDRDEFAKAALAGLCADNRNVAYRGAVVIAEDAYRLADAMIAEREKSQPAKEVAQPASPSVLTPRCVHGSPQGRCSCCDRYTHMQAETGRADKPLPPDEIEAPPDRLVDVSTFKRKERADKPDEWDEMAEGLLPCVDIGYFCQGGDALHASGCPASCRPAVAAKLRELAWEHKRIFDEAANDSERKLALIKAYKAKLAEAERERDEAREMSRTGDALREHNRARKAERDIDALSRDVAETTRRLDAAERARDNAFNALSAARALWSKAATERQATQAKYREAVELMRPIEHWVRCRVITERWGMLTLEKLPGDKDNLPVLHAIARFVEEHDRVEAADKEAK